MNYLLMRMRPFRAALGMRRGRLETVPFTSPFRILELQLLEHLRTARNQVVDRDPVLDKLIVQSLEALPGRHFVFCMRSEHAGLMFVGIKQLRDGIWRPANPIAPLQCEQAAADTLLVQPVGPGHALFPALHDQTDGRGNVSC